MFKVYRKAVKRALTQVAKGKLAGVDKNAGICLFIKKFIYKHHKSIGEEQALDIASNFSLKHAKGWEHFSGDSAFPIPVTEDRFSTPQSQYLKGRLWEDKQLEFRKAYASYLLTKLD